MEKIMFFAIPEIPSKTFVMLYKKLPDHFKVVLIIIKGTGILAGIPLNSSLNHTIVNDITPGHTMNILDIIKCRTPKIVLRESYRLS